MRFAVEVSQLSCVVARAGGQARRYRRVDTRDIRSIKGEPECPEQFRELAPASSADDWHDVLSP